MKQQTLAIAADQGAGLERYRRPTKRDVFLAVDCCVRCTNAYLGSPAAGRGGSEVARRKLSALVRAVSTRRHALPDRDAGADQSP